MYNEIYIWKLIHIYKISAIQDEELGTNSAKLETKRDTGEYNNGQPVSNFQQRKTWFPRGKTYIY